MHRAAAALPRARALPRPPRGAVWALALLVALGAGFLWFRDSSLVAVRRVTVVGLSGPDATKVAERLRSAALDMTTLHVRRDQLRAVAAPYPIVKDLDVHAAPPHALRIVVHENAPVAVVVAGDERLAVAADGRLLRGAGAAASLPVVHLAAVPGGDHVVDPAARQSIAALAAAPRALRARVQRVGVTRTEGLRLTMRSGPELRFGGSDRLAAKWAAAAAVLADPDSVGATYLDLRYPEHPAAGGLQDPASQQDPATVNLVAPEPTAPTPGTSP